MVGKGSTLATWLLASALLITLFTVVTLAQPSYVSQNFEVYDYAGAGQSYLQRVAEALESALAAVAGRGASIARPCTGSRYIVNVVRIQGGEQGFTKSRFIVDEAGRVKDACIAWVNISTGLQDAMLRAVSHHELIHVAQAGYYRYASVAQAYPWYNEAMAEGFGSALSGVCAWAPYYFTYGLYRYNPYRFSGTDTRCYALGAFYYWILTTGYSSLDTALRGSLSGENVFSSWVNTAYLDFLLSLAKGVTLCGNRYEPESARVYLPGGTWSTTVTLDGLSAAYFRIELPAPGPVLVSATGNVRSNIQLGQPFTTQNTSLLIVLSNSRLESATVNLTVYYRPPLEAKLVNAFYDGWSGSMRITIYVLYAGRPVTGLIDVDGIPVEASNGYATFTLVGASWGGQVLRISHAGAEARVKFNIARPVASLATHPTLYLASNGRGEIRVALRNPGDTIVRAEVSLEPSPFMRTEPVIVDAPPGESSVGLRFNVTSTPTPATLHVKVCYAPGDCVPLELNTAPVELRVLRAWYDSAANVTRVEAVADPAQLRLTATVKGLNGTALFRYSTYWVGGVNISLPVPVIELSPSPLLVAPSWVILRLNATVRVESSCPSFNVSYALHVHVNGVVLGSIELSCGDVGELTSEVNLTYTDASLLLSGPFIKPTLFSVPKPLLDLKAIDWILDDEGSSAKVNISVKGPCKFLLLGREVVNETVTIERRLEKGVRALEIDLGFEILKLEIPRVELELNVPRVALAGLPVPVTLILRTEAEVNATVAVGLAGEEVESLRMVKPGAGEAKATVTLKPLHPGVYSIAALAWFANASASLLYVRVLGLTVEASRFALVGAAAPIRPVLILEPPSTPHVNLTVMGCGPELELNLEANSTTLLSFDRACKAVVVARFLNYTASTVTYWDVLTLTFEKVLGSYDGSFIVPNGTLKPVALFANATPAPAKVLVDGQPTLTLNKPGSYTVKLEAELWGVRNETIATVYAVPEDLYATSIELLRRLGEPSHLVSTLKLAVLSGRWERIRLFVDTHNSARRAAPEPMAILATVLTEKWAREGNDTYLNAAQALLALRPAVYLALIAAVGVVLAKRARRKPREASRPQGNEAQQPSS